MQLAREDIVVCKCFLLFCHAKMLFQPLFPRYGHALYDRTVSVGSPTRELSSMFDVKEMVI